MAHETSNHSNVAMQPKGKVLLAEDDPALAFLIRDSLQDEGYAVNWCADGETAWKHFSKNPVDICLLDVSMPAKDGLTLARRIRTKSDVVPILFLTARTLEEDRLDGFRAGGDDYITKPFNMRELLMRIEVFLRRSKRLRAETVPEYQLGTFRFSYAHLKMHSGSGSDISLTQREADLLKFFCEHSNTVLKRQEILLNVWGKNDYFLGRSMDVFITRLRKYFKPDPAVVLETIHGIGFRLNTAC